jgi:hypothetical protein
MTAMPDLDLTRTAPVTDEDAARLASPAAFTDLASQIMATPVPAARRRAHWTYAIGARLFPGRSVVARPRRRLALLTAIPVALAVLAAFTVTLTSRGDDGPDSGTAIEAMSFVKENGTITVIIKNLYADTSWYNADLARHHLNITLHLDPTPPSLVGFIGSASFDGAASDHIDEIRPISTPGSCDLSGTECQIGFTVPAGFQGKVDLWIGRPARPGEQYQEAGSAFNRGEPLYGLADQIFGHPLSEVLPLLGRHHVTVAQCREAGPGQQGNGVCDPATMPGTWYVNDVIPWAPNQVLLAIQSEPYPSPLPALLVRDERVGDDGGDRAEHRARDHLGGAVVLDRDARPPRERYQHVRRDQPRAEEQREDRHRAGRDRAVDGDLPHRGDRREHRDAAEHAAEIP